LAVQAVNGTYGDEDRDNMNLEFGALQSEITRIAGSTYFNGIDVIGASNTLTFQVGFESTDTMTLTTQTMTASALNVDAAVEDIDTATNATDSLSAIDSAITTVDSYRGDLGAKANRLAYSSANLESRIENQSAARSRIMDADYAAESANLARTQVLQQAGAAMLAQANASTSTVLSLLK
jgi:flagellin